MVRSRQGAASGRVNRGLMLFHCDLPIIIDALYIFGPSADEKQSFPAASILGILARDRKQAQAK
jgi:hypothetical protein